MQSFKFLMYIGPLCYLYGLYVNRRHIRTRNLPTAYVVLLLISAFMWLRFDPYGHNGGTVQEITGAFSMFLFLIFLYDPKIFRLEDMRRWAIVAALCGMVFSVLFWDNILAADAFGGTYSENVGGVAMAMATIYIIMGCGFFLFIYQYYSRRFTYFALFATMLAIVVAMNAGRRGYTVINLMFVAQYVFFVVANAKGKKRVGAIIFVSVFLAGCFAYYLMFKDTQLAMFFQRLDSDSRSSVFDGWNNEMAKNVLWWVWGKGVSGGYYDTFFETVRPNIENGLRHMILKGGLLYYLSYVGVALYITFLGVFRSKNKLCRGVAIYAFFLFIFTFVWGAPSISYTHLFMWMGYTWVNDKRIRRMNDQEVFAYLNQPHSPPKNVTCKAKRGEAQIAQTPVS